MPTRKALSAMPPPQLCEAVLLHVLDNISKARCAYMTFLEEGISSGCKLHLRVLFDMSISVHVSSHAIYAWKCNALSC